MRFDLETFEAVYKVRAVIRRCESKHVQQVVYSTYHDAFTQICFTCQKVRTTIVLSELKP